MKVEKRYLTIINNMEIGGTRSSLINLLSYLAESIEKVDLLVLSPFGPYMKDIPNKVHVVKPSLIIKCSFSKPGNLNIFERFLKGVMHCLRLIVGYNALYSLVFKSYAKKIGSYDAVIGFQEGESNDCAAYINAKSRTGWMHNDYSNFSETSKGIPDAYRRLDNLVFVAESSLKSFVSYYPDYIKKCHVIRNTLNQESIIAKSLQTPDVKFNRNHINIISVGRVTLQKRFDRIIEIVSALKERLNFKWFIIGDGDQKASLVNTVKDKGLDDYIIFLGPSSNPYCYMANADLLVVTSDYEAQPMVILESLTIGTPVVSTDYNSAIELKDLAGDSLKITSKSSLDIANTIADLLTNNELVIMKEAATKFQYDNMKIIREIISITS